MVEVSSHNILLTAAQRNVVADLLPKLADRLTLDEKNARTIYFTAKEHESIRQKAEAARSHADTGMIRNSLPHMDGNLAESLQVAHDAGTKRILLPMGAATATTRATSTSSTKLPDTARPRRNWSSTGRITRIFLPNILRDLERAKCLYAASLINLVLVWLPRTQPARTR